MSDIDVGLIGYGLAGSVFHAPLIAATPGMRLAAVVTRAPERVARVAEDHPGARVEADAEALIASGTVDLVVVASPNRTHVPLARAAIRAGVPVLVDKPLAAAAGEGRALVEEAEARGVMLTVFQNRRWDGDFLTVRRLIEAGEVGDVVRFESRFDRWRLEPKPGWRQHPDRDEAGGLLYDLGAHLVDQALTLFGPVREVYAELDRRRGASQVDDDSFVALTHESGVRSHLGFSIVAALPAPRFRLLGTRGAFEKRGLDPQEEALRSGARPGPGWGEEPDERWGTLSDGETARRVPTEPGAYPAFYAALAASLRGGGPPPVDPWDSVRVLEVIERAMER